MKSYKTMVLNLDEHRTSDNQLIRLLVDGWKVTFATPLVSSVSCAGHYHNVEREHGKVAYVLEYDDERS